MAAPRLFAAALLLGIMAIAAAQVGIVSNAEEGAARSGEALAYSIGFLPVAAVQSTWEGVAVPRHVSSAARCSVPHLQRTSSPPREYRSLHLPGGLCPFAF